MEKTEIIITSEIYTKFLNLKLVYNFDKMSTKQNALVFQDMAYSDWSDREIYYKFNPNGLFSRIIKFKPNSIGGKYVRSEILNDKNKKYVRHNIHSQMMICVSSILKHRTLNYSRVGTQLLQLTSDIERLIHRHYDCDTILKKLCKLNNQLDSSPVSRQFISDEIFNNIVDNAVKETTTKMKELCNSQEELDDFNELLKQEKQRNENIQTEMKTTSKDIKTNCPNVQFIDRVKTFRFKMLFDDSEVYESGAITSLEEVQNKINEIYSTISFQIYEC